MTEDTMNTQGQEVLPGISTGKERRTDVTLSDFIELMGRVDKLEAIVIKLSDQIRREIGNRQVANSALRKLIGLTNGKRLNTVVEQEKAKAREEKRAKQPQIPAGFVQIQKYIEERLGREATMTSTPSALVRLGAFPSAQQFGPFKTWIAKQSEVDYLVGRMVKVKK